MIAINTDIEVKQTHKVRCPKCRGRICDMVTGTGNPDRVISDNSKVSDLIIKCHKCGRPIGITLNNIIEC